MLGFPPYSGFFFNVRFNWSCSTGTGIVAERAFWEMEESRRSGAQAAELSALPAVLKEIRDYLPTSNLLHQMQEAFPNDWSMKLVNFGFKDRKVFEDRLMVIIAAHSLPGESSDHCSLRGGELTLGLLVLEAKVRVLGG